MKGFNMWMAIAIIGSIAFFMAAIVGVEREKTAQMAIQQGITLNTK